jgi:hypothetical protein
MKIYHSLCMMLVIPLHAAQLIPISSKLQFDEYLSKERAVVLIVSDEGCLPCKMVKQWLETERFMGITFLVANYAKALAFNLGQMRGVPTIFGYKNGHQAFIQVGFGTRISGLLRKKIIMLI